MAFNALSKSQNCLYIYSFCYRNMLNTFTQIAKFFNQQLISMNITLKPIVKILSATAIVLLASCTAKPVACFIVDKGKTAKPNEEVQFDAACTLNADTYSWNFGDSTTRTGITTRRKFTVAKTYRVVLTATKNNNSDTSAVDLVIAP
jgi:PKD repeat protein